jgi:hypothetical protein
MHYAERVEGVDGRIAVRVTDDDAGLGSADDVCAPGCGGQDPDDDEGYSKERDSQDCLLKEASSVWIN